MYYSASPVTQELHQLSRQTSLLLLAAAEPHQGALRDIVETKWENFVTMRYRTSCSLLQVRRLTHAANR